MPKMRSVLALAVVVTAVAAVSTFAGPAEAGGPARYRVTNRNLTDTQPYTPPVVPGDYDAVRGRNGMAALPSWDELEHSIPAIVVTMRRYRRRRTRPGRAPDVAPSV